MKLVFLEPEKPIAAWNVNASTTTFSVDGKNQLTSGPTGSDTYDGNGNLTQEGTTDNTQYSYDAENRLVQVINYSSYVGSTVNRTDFAYDGLGRLRKRTEYSFDQPSWSWVWTGEVHYIYDGMRAVQERDNSNTPSVSYTRGTDLSGSLEGAGGIGGLLARSDGYSAGSWTSHNFYHADGNGNITYLVNSSQTLAASYRYDAYGNTISLSGSLCYANVYRFSSKEIHPTWNLYYYGYRWYSPNLQRWLNRDPMSDTTFQNRTGFAGSRKRIEKNLYCFVLNDPLGLLDSWGLDTTPWPLNGKVCNCPNNQTPVYVPNRHKVLPVASWRMYRKSNRPV